MEKTWADGDGLTHGQTKKPCKFRIHAVDADGNPATTGADPFEVKITGPQDVTPKFVDNKDGTYDVEYAVEVPGTYNIDVNLHGDPIKDSPFHPKIKWSCDPNQCYAEGEGLREVFDNKPTGFTIHAVDYDGNARVDGGDPFVVKINSDSEGDVPVHVVDNHDGTYSVTYAPQKPGNLHIDVSLEDQNIKDAPFTVECKAGTDHSTSGFSNFTFTIQTRDKRGENKTFGGDDFAVLSSDSSVSVNTKDNGNGSYTASFGLEKKGQYSFQVLFNGKELACSPLRVNL